MKTSVPAATATAVSPGRIPSRLRYPEAEGALGGVVKRTIQFRIFRGDGQYVAECVDLPVVTQALTLDELAANIREALALHLEGEDLAELGLVEHPAVLATMELDAVA